MKESTIYGLQCFFGALGGVLVLTANQQIHPIQIVMGVLAIAASLLFATWYGMTLEQETKE